MKFKLETNIHYRLIQICIIYSDLCDYTKYEIKSKKKDKWDHLTKEQKNNRRQKWKKNSNIYLESTFNKMPCKQIRGTNKNKQQFSTNK